MKISLIELHDLMIQFHESFMERAPKAKRIRHKINEHFSINEQMALSIYYQTRAEHNKALNLMEKQFKSASFETLKKLPDCQLKYDLMNRIEKKNRENALINNAIEVIK